MANHGDSQTWWNIEHRPGSIHDPIPADLFPAGAAAALSRGQGEVVTRDHYVDHVSTAPATEGETQRLYVREVSPAQPGTSDPDVVLCCHGGTWPSSMDYDCPYKDYSWMRHLARAGFRAFGVDMVGYGLSTRPAPMEEPRNLARENQELLIPDVLPAPSEPTFPYRLQTLPSEWDALNSAVDAVRALTGAARINLIGWSGGGPRMGGYAARQPEKIKRVVLLAPAYTRDEERPRYPWYGQPEVLPVPGPAFTIHTRAQSLEGLWDSQVKYENQFEPGIRDVLWNLALDQDKTGASWSTPTTGDTGVVRVPTWNWWGWSKTRAASVQAPTLVMVGELDRPEMVAGTLDLFHDLGSTEKAHVSIERASHYAPWETAYSILHEITLRWLLKD